MILGTVVLINSRFVLYSASFAGWFADEPLRRRLVLVFPLVDQLYVLCEERFRRGDLVLARRSYYVAAADVLVCGWVALQTIAVVFAAALPDPSALAVAAPLSLGALLVVTVKDRATVAAAIGGSLAAVGGVYAPNQVGLLLAIFAGVIAGTVVDRKNT